MPLNTIKLLIVMRAQTPGGNQREINLTYDVPPEEPTPVAGLNLTAPQKAKLADRLQQMGLLLDENDTTL
jgi:hypothetical protein